jgi:hypothetical protein
MLGYSLGDVNVQTAMQWANVFQDEQGLEPEPYQSLVVQARFVRGPAPEPYSGANGEIIIEVSSILSFLKEVVGAIKRREKAHEKAKKVLKDYMDQDLSKSSIADDNRARRKFIRALSQFPRCYDVQTLIQFLDAVLEPIWSQAREYGGFEYYAPFLDILLDIFENLPFGDCHPSLFSYLADRLDDVAYYIDPEHDREKGTSFAATDLWFSRKQDIPKKMLSELRRYAKQHGGYRMERMI